MPVVVNGRVDGEWEIGPDFATGCVVMTLVLSGRRHTATVTEDELPAILRVLGEFPETGRTDLSAAFTEAVGRDPFDPSPYRPHWVRQALSVFGGLSLALSGDTPWTWLRVAGWVLVALGVYDLLRSVWRRVRA